jgi:hypothetical protein
MKLIVLADDIGAERFHPTPVTALFNELDVHLLPDVLSEQVARSQGLIMMCLTPTAPPPAYFDVS